MKKIYNFYIIFGLLLFTFIFIPNSVKAFSLIDGINCGELNSTERPPAVCNSSSENPISGAGGLLIAIANIVAYVAGAAAIILIIAAAIRFVTSGGDPGNVKKARDTVLYALIGIAIVILARTIIFFILSVYN